MYHVSNNFPLNFYVSQSCRAIMDNISQSDRKNHNNMHGFSILWVLFSVMNKFPCGLNHARFIFLKLSELSLIQALSVIQTRQKEWVPPVHGTARHFDGRGAQPVLRPSLAMPLPPVDDDISELIICVHIIPWWHNIKIMYNKPESSYLLCGMTTPRYVIICLCEYWAMAMWGPVQGSDNCDMRSSTRFWEWSQQIHTGP